MLNPVGSSTNVSLEGTWERNTDFSFGYDFGKWSVMLGHRFHLLKTDSFFRTSTSAFSNPARFRHHDLSLLVGLTQISRQGRVHQLQAGFTVNNVGSSYRGLDVNQPDQFPATISNQYNSFNLNYLRQLIAMRGRNGSRWFHHFYLKLSADYAPNISLPQVRTKHQFFRFGLGLQYQFSSLWQRPMASKALLPVVSGEVKPKALGRFSLLAGVRAELPISAFREVLPNDPPSDYDFEFNQFAAAPTLGVRYYFAGRRLAATYVPGVKKTVVDMKTVPADFDGSQVAAVMKFGRWVVDHHLDFQWYLKEGERWNGTRKKRVAFGTGLAWMNPGLSIVETTVPEIAGRRLRVDYFTVNAFASFELGRDGFFKNFFVEPRLMLVPSMPAFSIADRRLHVMSTLRIYKELFAGKKAG